MNIKTKIIISVGHRDIDEIIVYIARVNCEHQYIPGIYSVNRISAALKTRAPAIKIFRTGIKLTYQE